MALVYITMFIFVAAISCLWVRGIDNMHRNHPNYKGEDFLGEDNESDKG